MSVSTLDGLLGRRSCKFVTAPGPDAQALRKMFEAAACAPDHGALRPWRFAVIQGQAVSRLADVALSAVKASGDPRMTSEKEKSTRQWLSKVPTLIAVAQKIDHDNTKIPEQEQLLAAGAAAMNLLNAAHLLGYAAFWSTGLGTYVEAVQEALGFDPLDYRFLGFIAVGTPAAELPPAHRPDPDSFVRAWTGD
ncbi:nitroreductase [Orrella sp. JC864]|uniref:nitroreductase family protein n=1 Tax=Orrella sp. JC864 TaxID=3120298 RepID=UPI0012BBA9A5